MQLLRRWLFDGEGDLNPTLLLMTLYALTGLQINYKVIDTFAVSPIAYIVIPSLLLYDLLSMIVFAIGWYKLGRAKILANARVLIAGNQALGRASEAASKAVGDVLEKDYARYLKDNPSAADN